MLTKKGYEKDVYLFYEVHKVECDNCGTWYLDFKPNCKCGSPNPDFGDWEWISQNRKHETRTLP